MKYGTTQEVHLAIKEGYLQSNAAIFKRNRWARQLAFSVWIQEKDLMFSSDAFFASTFQQDFAFKTTAAIPYKLNARQLTSRLQGLFAFLHLSLGTAF